MGRKIDMKKIENITKCQVTFSKRRSSLMKKANEIAVCCDVDVAFVAFSPSGRISKYSNQKRIEDVVNRYVNLTADKRLTHINNVEGKMEKLKQLSHINGDTSKLQFLDKQIENLELQIKKSGLELQILETDLRDYELGPEQEPSLHQLSWCERNLSHSLRRVLARKDFLQMNQTELQSQTALPPYSSTFNEKGQASTSANLTTGQILMHLDPWISPYSARVRENLFQDLFDQGKHTTNGNLGQVINSSNIPIQEPPAIFSSEIITSAAQVPPQHIPLEQSLMLDQPLLNFHDKINVSAWNNASHVVFSDATHMSTPILCSSVDRRFSSITIAIPNPSRGTFQPLFDVIGSGLQSTMNPNLTSQFSNMEAQGIGGLNMDHNGSSSFINGNPRNDNEQLEDYCRINSQTHNNDQLQDAYIVQPPNEASENAPAYGSFYSQDANGDNSLLTSNEQRTGLWEWEDFLLDEKFNFQHHSQA